MNAEIFALDPRCQQFAEPVLNEASLGSIASSPSSLVDSPVSSHQELSSSSSSSSSTPTSSSSPTTSSSPSPFESCPYPPHNSNNNNNHGTVQISQSAPPQPPANVEQLFMNVSASPASSACSAPTLSASPPCLSSLASPPLTFESASKPPTTHAAPESPSMLPPATTTGIHSHVQPQGEGLQNSPVAEFESVCRTLKEMAESGTSASVMMSFLTLSRQAIKQDIPAEIVLEGMITYENRKLTTPPSPKPSCSTSTSSFGAQRRPRSSLREAASPYAIPTGPRMYQCDQCPLVFDRAYNLKEHLKTHDPHCNKRFPCPLQECSHASHRRADMHRHIKNVHLKREGLTATQRNMVVAAYPALQPDMFPQHHPYLRWDVQLKRE